MRINFGAGFTVWSASSGTAGRHASEQIDLQIRHAPLGSSGLRFDASLTAIRWESFAGDLRFRPSTPTQLYVWEAEVSRREQDDRTVFALGRMWAWHLPGVPMLDGAEIGRRNEAGTLEWGAYGGIIPNTVSLVPVFDTWAAGVYGSSVASGGADDALRFTRGEARLGVRESASVGLVSEGEIVTGLAFTHLDVEAGARARYARQIDPNPLFEMAHLDLRLRLGQALAGWLVLRYLGTPPEQQPLLANEQAAVRGGYHAVFNASWDVTPRVSINVVASSHFELGTDVREQEGGLELRLPLFGPAAGLWLGGTAGEGWMRSRTAYLQLLGRSGPALIVLARFTADTSQFADPSQMANLAELGGNLQVEIRLTDHVRLRAHGLVRVPVSVQGTSPTGSETSYVAGLDLLGAL